jgi:hypothetical protein
MMLKRLFAAAALICALLFAQAAAAQERLGDGAMGALAGVFVAGPIGLIAGGVVGYTAGPNIAHGMFHHHRRYYDRRLHRWVWR